MRSCVTHECFGIKPCCWLVKRLFLNKYSNNLSLITDSRILQTTGVKLIGLWLDGSFQSPFLNTGITSATFHILGSELVSKNVWNNIDKGLVNSTAASLKRRGCQSSGPGDLLTSKLHSVLYIYHPLRLEDQSLVLLCGKFRGFMKSMIWLHYVHALLKVKEMAVDTEPKVGSISRAEGSLTSRNVVDDYGNLAMFIRNIEIFVGNSEIRNIHKSVR